ncbi:MAG: gluconate 2-dehydrogenase subunit 3 family protein [Haloferacaceae archaeon]
MRLTRRDALAALAAAGVAGGGGAVLLSERDGEDANGPLGGRVTDTLVAAAEVLYPSEVEGVGTFVRRYARARAEDRPEHAAGVAAAAGYLDEYAEAWHGQRFAALDPATRDDALRRMGADDVDPDPSGSDAERVRYYVVNELLFALYASPTGGKLVGIENPQGHPGGLASYQRGPES